MPPGPPGPPGRPFDEERAPRRRGPARVVLAVLAVLVLFAGVAVYVVGTDDETALPPVTTSSTVPDTATSEPEPPVDEDEFLALVEELQEFVSEARGLPFLRPVVVELEDDEGFQARLLEDFREEADRLDDTEVFYRALGLMTGERSLRDELEAIYAVGVIGFYDPETDELVVRGASASPYVQQTIVHELVHALDDQHFDLERDEYDERDDEIAAGFTAVVEGNARRIERAWMDSRPDDFQAAARAEERAYGESLDLTGFPPILLFQIAAPYELGQLLVAHIIGQGGERAVDEALLDPPDTTKQVLDPSRYDVREPRIDVPAPPADGELVDEGVVGALFLLGLFTTGDSPVSPIQAFRAVSGWGGDWAVTWTDGDLHCVRADFVGDTPTATDELAEALELWTTAHEWAEVSEVDGRVRLDSCTSSAASGPSRT